MAVKLSEKIGYCLGDAAAGGITWKVMSIAFPFFFTNIFGLTVADAGALMLLARLFDVVTDPLMGAIADRTKSRWGTYRPWLIFGAIPLGVVFALLLYTPDLGPAGRRVYAYSLYLLMMVVYTAVNVPYGSLLGVSFGMNKKERIQTYASGSTHAMTLIAVDIKDGKPVKWMVENSWGADSGYKGNIIMTDEWFNEYMFRLVVEKKYIPADVMAQMKQKPILLPAWDPMFAPEE